MARAFYFGCIDLVGHYFHSRSNGRDGLYASEICALAGDNFPQAWAQLMDGGLLTNGKRSDVYDGKVFAVPANGQWTAFVWWDNSVDKRGASNSGFYVHGFEWERRQEALEFAMKEWPEVVHRQRHPLHLDDGGTPDHRPQATEGDVR